MKFLFWLVACFFSTFGFTYFFSRIVDEPRQINYKIIFVFIIGVIIQTLIKTYDIMELSIISYFLFYPFLFYLIKPMKLKKLFYHTLVIWGIALLLDFIMMLVVSGIGNYIFLKAYESYLFKLIPTIIIFFVFCNIANLSFVKKGVNKIYNAISKIKYADFSLILFSGFIFLVGMILVTNISHYNIAIIISIILILTIVAFALLIKSKFDGIENRIFVESLKENNYAYLKMETEQEILKHNLIAKILAVKSVANKKARLLLDDLVLEFNNNIDFNGKIKVIPYGLNGIISQKLNDYYEKIDIKISNNINRDIFDVLSPKRYNVLVEKLSILIDNAIEACLNSIEKVLIINLTDENGYIFIEVKNTFSGEIDIEHLGNLRYSTKGKKRGLGLYSTFRNNEVSVNVKLVNNYFVTRLCAKIMNL